MITPQPAAVPSSPLESFRPLPANEFNEVKLYLFVGAKVSEWTDNGQTKTSLKLFVIVNADTDSEYSEFIGRVPTTLSCTRKFITKLKQYRINPQDITPYRLETKTVGASKGGVKLIVTDIHPSPYQKEQLQKGIQPLTVNPPN